VSVPRAVWRIGDPSDRSRATPIACWLPARCHRWRCLVRGHRWSAAIIEPGAVLVSCAGCRELISVPFVDTGEPFGSTVPAGPLTAFGEIATARRSLQQVAVALDGDSAAGVALRADATARPGQSVDSLVQIAVAIVRLSDSDSGVLMRALGAYLDLAQLQADLATWDAG
jgi:hypothetical protein